MNDNTMKNLEKICTNMITIVRARAWIRERQLLDLGRVSLSILNNLPDTMPESYHELFDITQDYCVFESYRDRDAKRVSTYIRLHQTLLLLHIAMVEKERKEKIQTEIKQNRINWPLIKYLYENPGVTFSEVEDKIGGEKEHLMQELKILIEKGFVSKEKLIHYDLYQLSLFGIDLHHAYSEVMGKKEEKFA